MKVKRIKLKSRDFFEKSIDLETFEEFEIILEEVIKELNSLKKPIIKLSVKAYPEILNKINFPKLRKKLLKYGKVYKIEKVRKNIKKIRIEKINKEISYKDMAKHFIEHFKPKNSEKILKLTNELIDEEFYGEQN